MWAGRPSSGPSPELLLCIGRLSQASLVPLLSFLPPVNKAYMTGSNGVLLNTTSKESGVPSWGELGVRLWGLERAAEQNNLKSGDLSSGTEAGGTRL